MLHDYLQNSRNSWDHKISATQYHERVASPEDIEIPELKLVEA